MVCYSPLGGLEFPARCPNDPFDSVFLESTSEANLHPPLPELQDAEVVQWLALPLIRYKALIGTGSEVETLQLQVTEVRLAVNVLNRMLELGAP